jgi:hypothetical protein
MIGRRAAVEQIDVSCLNFEFNVLFWRSSFVIAPLLQQLFTMATRVMLVQGAAASASEAASAFALQSLRAASRCDSSQLAGRVISMPHPRTGTDPSM